MAEIISREQQVLFLNSNRVNGVQNCSFQYSTTNSPFRSMGRDQSSYDSLPQRGQFSVDALAISSDPFISFTGDLGANGYLLKNSSNSAENYSFLSGYLTSYSASCSVGEIPRLSANFEVFGNIGKITQSESSDFAAISSSSISPVRATSFEDFSLSVDGFNSARVISFDVNINVNRRADYPLGTRNPIRVALNWPIQVEASFVISAAEYNAFNIRNFPHSARKTDLSLNFKVTNSAALTVLSYSFVNMVLASESYSSNVDGKSTVTLTYQSYVGKVEIPRDNLLIYLNATNTTSYQSDTYIENLKFNNYNFTITDNSKFNPYLIDLNGSSSTMISGRDYLMPTKFSICFWICYFNTSGIASIVSWGAGANEIQINYENTFNPLALSTGYDSDIFSIGPTNGSGLWSLISLVFDSTTSTLRYYLNNGTFMSNTSIGGANIIGSRDYIYIGSRAGQDRFLNANINKFFFYEKLLSAQEIKDIYSVTSPDVVNLPVV